MRERLQATTSLSRPDTLLCWQVVLEGAVEPLVACLANKRKSAQLQSRAAAALLDIAKHGSAQAARVVDAGGPAPTCDQQAVLHAAAGSGAAAGASMASAEGRWHLCDQPRLAEALMVCQQYDAVDTAASRRH